MILAAPGTAALAALFLWWASTGVILYVVRWADAGGTGRRRAATFGALPLAVLGAAGFIATLHDPSVQGVYLAFLSALAIWAWIELAFLTGTIAGPVTSPLPPATREFERFIRAWGTIAYHEMLLTAAFLGMMGLAIGAENSFGFWTFAILFSARISAKLNLYLGVRKVNVEFLPRALTHLESHFRVAQMNWLFPISVTGLSFALACWLERLWGAATVGDAVGFALLSALTALALLEHWFMVLPLPDERLWRWMLPDHDRRARGPQNTQTRLKSEEPHGI